MNLDFLFGVIDPTWAAMLCLAVIGWALDSWRDRRRRQETDRARQYQRVE